MWNPWKAYVTFANERGEAVYMKFHGRIRWRQYCKENNVVLYKMRPLRMLLEERRQQREYQEETLRLGREARLRQRIYEGAESQPILPAAELNAEGIRRHKEDTGQQDGMDGKVETSSTPDGQGPLLPEADEVT